MSDKGVLIKLEDIKINKENFRHSPLNSELEAIHYLITEDYKAYLTLAKEMQQDCRTFTALILKKDDEMILMDANRRISVLKIFDDPSLIPVEKKYDDLRNLCEAKGSLGIKEFYADIYYDSSDEDKENLMRALDEIHINDNHTRKDWNALSQYRASKFIGSAIKHPWIKTLEFYGYSDDEIIEMTKKRADIFSRFLKKQKLLIASNGKMNIKNDKEIIKRICKIVEERGYYLNGEVITVNTRSSKGIYDDILDDLIQKYSNQQTSLDLNDTKAKEVNNPKVEYKKDIDKPVEQTQLNLNQPENKPKSNNSSGLRRDVEQRKTIISTEQRNELSMTANKQVNQIAYELSILNIHTYVVCAPILFRSFLQYSFDWYASNNDITSGMNSGLTSKIDTVANSMYTENKITREEKSRIKMLIKNTDVINLLNDATHNFESEPFAKTILIDLYNAVHPLIKAIYN